MKKRKEARKPGSDTRYTYAVGRIRALEARLIAPPEMERLLEEGTFAEALRALAEFPDYAEIAASPHKDIEEVLEEHLREVYELVCELSLGSNVIKTLRLKYDFHNLKVLLKAKLLGAEPEGLSSIAFLSPEQSDRALAERDVERADPFVGEIVLAAVAGLNGGASLDRIDTILDRFYYETFLENLSVNPFLQEYARRTIDLINLRVFWRVQAMGWPAERLSESLLPGGTVAPAFFSSNSATPVPDLLPKIPHDPYRVILRESLAAYQSKKDLLALDRLADDFLVEFLRKAKYYSFGLEPLVGYIAAKENEVRQLRIILLGKEKTLSMDELRRLLRRSYA